MFCSKVKKVTEIYSALQQITDVCLWICVYTANYRNCM